MPTIRDTLNERGERYRRFPDNARTAQAIKDEFRETKGWHELDDYMAEALDVIASKIARILNGDPAYKDNWVDIMGYCQLVLDELEAEPQTTDRVVGGWRLSEKK